MKGEKIGAVKEVFWSSSKRQHVEVVAVPSYDMCCVLQLFYFSLDVVDVASPLPLSPSYSTFYACLSKACKLSFSCPVFLFKSTSFCYMCHWRPPSQHTEMFEKAATDKNICMSKFRQCNPSLLAFLDYVVEVATFLLKVSQCRIGHWAVR